MKAGNKFSEYKHISTIYIQSINASEFGQYVITAWNDIGIFSRIFTVTLKSK